MVGFALGVIDVFNGLLKIIKKRKEFNDTLIRTRDKKGIKLLKTLKKTRGGD